MSRLFLPAATNYMTDPRLTAAWDVGLPAPNPVATVAVANETMHISAGAYVNGDDWTYLFSNTSAVGSFAAGEAATFSASFWGTATNCLVRIAIVAADAAGTYLAESATNVIAGTPLATPTRISVTYASLPATTSRVRAHLVVQQLSAGDTYDFYMTQPIMEKSPFPTPYFDGASTDSLNASTYAWTGAANASTSTRALSVLHFPMGSSFGATGTGTLAARILAKVAAGTAGQPFWPVVVFNATTITHRVQVFWTPLTNRIDAAAYDGTNYPRCNHTISAWNADTIHSSIARFTAGGTIDLMTDGVAATQVANTATHAGLNTIQIGNNGPNGNFGPWNGEGPILISPQRKSDAWVTAMDALLRATTVDLPAIKRMMAPGDALFTGAQADGSIIYTKGS